MTIKTTLIVVSVAAFLIWTPRGLAQDASPAPSAVTQSATTSAPATTPGPGGGNADFRQRMNDRLKAALKASDDEWAVIQPLLEKVQTAQRATMTARFGGGGGFGRRGGGGGGNGGGGNSTADAGASPGNHPSHFGSPEADALRDSLASDSTPDTDIKTKLQALRDARKKAAGDLEDARENLKKVLTLRQEATLVQMGVLD